VRDDPTGGDILLASTDRRGDHNRFHDLLDGGLFRLFPDRFEDKSFI
jgi:hypothetical protein